MPPAASARTFKARLSLLALPVLAAAWCGGCGVRRPEIRLRDIEVAAMDFEKVQLVLDFAVTNPNSYQVALYWLEYRLEASGASFATGKMSRPVAALAAKQTTVVKAPLTLAFADVPAPAPDSRPGTFDCRIAARATWDFVALKLHSDLVRAARMPVISKPTWRLRRMALADGGAELVIEVTNPNRFAIPVRHVGGLVKVKARTVGTVAADVHAAASGGKTTTLTVPVTLVEGGRAALQAVADAAEIRFEGRPTLAAPVGLHDLLAEGLKQP